MLSACSSADPKWETIFDGESLNGWTPKITGEELGQDSRETFRAKDGVLSVNYDNYDEFAGRFGHLFFERSLSDYRLKFEYRFVGGQMEGAPGWAFMNSGVMLLTQDPATIAVDQGFPVSVEAQLLGGVGNPSVRTTANICTPGTHIVIDGTLVVEHCINSATLGLPKDEWVQAEVDVSPESGITIFINGETAFVLTDPQLDPDNGDAQRILGEELALKEGYIALQSESHPVEFRNIELLDRSKS